VEQAKLEGEPVRQALVESKHKKSVEFNNKGVQLANQKRYREAVQYYDQAIEIRPDYAMAWKNKGVAHMGMGDFAASVTAFRECLRYEPDYPYCLSYYLDSRAMLCDWGFQNTELAEACEKCFSGYKSLLPMSALWLTDDPSLLQCAARIYSQNFSHVQPLKPWPRAQNGKLRVGYFSADLREHPVGYVMREFFSLYDKERIENTAFYVGHKKDDNQQQRLKPHFERFFYVGENDDESIVKLARELKIDVAVDLMGYTTHSRPGIMALRPAPLQISFLGYTGTMGAECIDYQIADHTVINVHNRQYHDESIIYMPDSYWVCDSDLPIADASFERANFKLPSDAMVYCCFNTSVKISQTCFQSWMRILQQVNDSVLWLRSDIESAQENLRLRASRHGIDPRRLIFSSRLEVHSEHLARYKLADLFLDTAPFNAHTTSSEALYAGLPVITYAGKLFAARVAASQLKAMGLPELVTNSQAEFEALAVALAHDRPRLAALRQKLEDNRHSTPLLDTKRYTRHFELALTMANERHRAGLPPTDFDVPPLFG